MDIAKVVFPLYKLRSYLSIDKHPLGAVLITTVKAEYILDDLNINAPFPERRAVLGLNHPNRKVYKLKEKVNYLRQLVKYRTGTTFIDHNGTLFRYKKSSKLHEVKSYPIIRKKPMGNWTVIRVDKLELSLLVSEKLTPETNFASIMHTDVGPFLYDLTSEQHEMYRRKI